MQVTTQRIRSGQLCHVRHRQCADPTILELKGQSPPGTRLSKSLWWRWFRRSIAALRANLTSWHERQMEEVFAHRGSLMRSVFRFLWGSFRVATKLASEKIIEGEASRSGKLFLMVRKSWRGHELFGGGSHNDASPSLSPSGKREHRALRTMTAFGWS